MVQGSVRLNPLRPQPRSRRCIDTIRTAPRSPLISIRQNTQRQTRLENTTRTLYTRPHRTGCIEYDKSCFDIARARTNKRNTRWLSLCLLMSPRSARRGWSSCLASGRLRGESFGLSVGVYWMWVRYNEGLGLGTEAGDQGDTNDGMGRVSVGIGKGVGPYVRRRRCRRTAGMRRMMANQGQLRDGGG